MTMVRQYPPPPLSPSTQPFGIDPYNSLPPSPHGQPLRNAVSSQHKGWAEQSMPQRYAHPLLRHNSYPASGSIGLGHEGENPSEHMLRRKTPKGILAAAYDGTSVELSEKPHATKHILLPVTAESNITNSNPFSLPLRSPRDGFTRKHSQIKQESSPNWSPTRYFETGSGQGHQGWNEGQSLPQIDSVLNQIPQQQQQQPLKYPNFGQQFWGGMDPIQSRLGPTVSNDQGPFGPYWHDGTFIPFSPAALRDPRFDSVHGPNWNVPNVHLQNGYSNKPGDWPAYGNIIPNMNNVQQNQYVLPGLASLTSPNPFNLGRQSLAYSQQYKQPQPYNPIPEYTNSALVTNLNRPALPNYSSLSSEQSTPLPDHTPVSSALAEFGPHSSNGQLREKVFAWAHAVYVDLLKYLQQTRKNSVQGRHPHGHQAVRPHIYPKPPRQPGANFSNSANNAPRPQNLERHNSYPLPSSHLSKEYDPNSQSPSYRGPSLRRHDSYNQPSSTWSSSGGDSQGPDGQRRMSWQQQPQGLSSLSMHLQARGIDSARSLRRMSGTSIAGIHQVSRSEMPPSMTAASALDAITKYCEESKWNWIDGILLGGCLAYALGDYQKAKEWYEHILTLDENHVEAIANLAATLLALQQKQEAERYWRRAVKLRPSYFEAVEHLIGLLCSDHRGQEAVGVIEEVERSLKFHKKGEMFKDTDIKSEGSNSMIQSPSMQSESSDRPVFEFDRENENVIKDLDDLPGSDQPGFGSSGYAIPGSDNGRILALVHAKGNMLYALGDNVGAAKAFETAVMIGAGQRIQGIEGLIKLILSVVGYDGTERSPGGRRIPPSTNPILLHPEPALNTARLCFPPHGQLPGLQYVPSEGMSRKAAISTTSNSLLSLAKIFQDGMSTNSPKASAYQTTYGVREILALYYLSLSLQPSPSTANNVGILLASVQQSAPSKHIPVSNSMLKQQIPGLVPGSGIALALAYYNYGLLLDSRHAHLYTNLGSLLKDMGQLDVAIQMYQEAVSCDPNFDIALANLANAVKDKGSISDAIVYYRRAVLASPDFAEAVCGLANALNSVCAWTGRGGIADDGGSRDRWHVDDKGMLLDARLPGASSSGWIKRVVDLVEKQLGDGEDWGRGTIDQQFMQDIIRVLHLTQDNPRCLQEKEQNMQTTIATWQGQKWEGARAVRLVERAIRRIMWYWYQDKYIRNRQRPIGSYRRPQLPAALTVPAAPTVLPFHTFTCPMSAKQIRLISQRNGLRISTSTLRAPWLPATVFAPPPPPNPQLRVGYVSSDFNNHPLAHLMQSVFGLHNPQKVTAYCYATTASDGSVHRQQIEREAPVFHDASSWPAERLVEQIVRDGIHILINLNGYTRGARNEVFAARPTPIQMSFMGFAGTLGAEWCDYLLADDTAVPPDVLRNWRRNIDLEDTLVDETSGGSDDKWVYAENIIFCRDTFFCCDHRQSAPDSEGPRITWEEEQQRRWDMRKELFPQLPDDAIILGNFNQLYKIEPTTFRTWLRILAHLPNAILWLLRFPNIGETHLRTTATLWAGPEVASRVIFTDVARKDQHIARARVCDLFLDTPECNAHTTAADILWSGTPLLTLPRYQYKMCSRMAASILKGALPKSEDGRKAQKELIAGSEEEYEDMAVRLGKGLVYENGRARGRLSELRRMLFEARWTSALFDTRRWVRDLEESYERAWAMWVRGEGGDIWLK
ncbi:hypothetical protein GQ43DRAFT_475249 [Delitschia confertaspora ATCC 74209]|uniref:protein O-GlcNAc transferase n=1 Tax=Delitschia confertaspora ATCC 74209 TaxID=1513339 RepID=A0A9P4JG39_9PLEO|nr:hypothetical protein GQ43DRAFT_475249 [Delitschia confertaspora ATCC 74209]